MGIRHVAFLAASASCVALASTTPVRAQAVVVTGQVPSSPPPASAAPAPPGYAPAPPPGYAPAPPPGYVPAYPQPTYIVQEGAPSSRRPHVIRDWSEGEPIPPGYHETTRARTGLVVGGAVLFGTTYLLSALTGAAGSDLSNCGCYGALFVPGVGPFVELGQSTTATGSLLLVLDGLSQLGGIAMFIAGFAAPKTVLVRDDYGSSQGFHIALAPILGPGRSGMGVVGTF